ncbi:MAG: M48 family metallopeptidase [Gemmatimonadota bacterium]
MDFFEAQDQARRLSRKLVLLFGLAVATMVVGVYLVAAVALGVADPGGVATAMDMNGGTISLFHPELFLVVTVGMLLVIGGGSLARTAQLRKGGSAVAELLGGRKVTPGTTDPGERRLMNVVEEMSIASGIPVPSVYILDGEPGINAFAAGHSIHDAAVAVTRGGIDTLTRAELQGVMAHEFSHILNGDMRLNLRLMGLLFGILLLTVVGRGILRGGYFRGGRSRGGGKGNSGAQIALIGLALILLGYLGVFFGRLIQAAVSRQREFLADAAAVQFTRNPDGIAGALMKIGGANAGSRLNNHHAQEAGHLFFSEGVKGAFSRSLATHPPLPMRIRRVAPHWDGEFVVPTPVQEGVERAPDSKRAKDARAQPFPFPFPGAGDQAGSTVLAGALLTAGTLEAATVQRAQALLDRIPESLRDATRSVDEAPAVILALLLSPDPEVSARQEGAARNIVGPQLVARASELLPAVTALGPPGRLPILELCLPALRELPAQDADALKRVVAPLTREDGEIHPFDFALYHLLRRALPGAPEPGKTARSGPPLNRLKGEVATLLSAVAWAGAAQEADAQRAFLAGASGLPDGVGASLALYPSTGLDLERVDAALGRLESAPSLERKKLLEALSRSVQADDEITVEELELLRAVAEALEIPMPPLAVAALT